MRSRPIWSLCRLDLLVDFVPMAEVHFERWVVGTMTGTSMDGLDVALVRIQGGGLEMKACLEGAVSRSLGPVADDLRRVAAQERLSAGEVAAVNVAFSRLHADAILDLLDGRHVDLIALHGQTVFHAPPVSWQLINASIVAATVGVPVISDMRAADLAAGGQGAPITPIADWILFGCRDETRAIVNLGGFANFTLLPVRTDSGADELAKIRAGDVCVCNQLLDSLARRLLDAAYDADGAAAMNGHASAAVASSIEVVLERQRVAGRSLGTGDEALVEHAMSCQSGMPPLAAGDILRSAVEAVARVIARSVTGADRLILAGGGAKNAALRKAIAEAAERDCVMSDQVKVPAEFREAMEMAVLGALCQDRVPITLPQVTGCPRKAPVAGCWVYP